MMGNAVGILKLFKIVLVFVFVVTNAYGDEARDGSATIVFEGKVADGHHLVSIKDIESIGVTSISIQDPFEKTKKSFEGVWLDRFAARFGLPDTTSIVFTAIDDYQVTFSKEEWVSTRIFLVTRVDDHYFEFDEKGPMRVVLPDYDPSVHNSKEILPKWIWMITRVTFK